MAVRKRSIADLEVVAAPNRLIREVFSAATAGATGLTLRVVDLVPRSEQAERRPHWHEGHEEVIYCLSGAGRIWAEGAWTDIRAGEMVLIPDGIVHATFNLTDEPLRLLCFFPVASGVDGRRRADFTVRLNEPETGP